MIKKLVVLLLMSFMITGCTKIPNTTTETSPVDNKEIIQNTYRLF